MTNNDNTPVAKSARAQRSGTSGNYTPSGKTAVDPELAAAKKAEQEQKRQERSAKNKVRAEATKETLAKRRKPLIITGIVVAVLLVIGIIEGVSASGGDPKKTVDEYIAAMNAKNPAVFTNTALFPLPSGVSLLPDNLLSQIDTSLVAAKPEIESIPDGARATISATNLQQPIIIDLKKTVTLDGVLLTPHWIVTTQLPTVTFVVADNVQPEAVLAVGATKLGAKNAPEVTAIATKTFASPIGTVTYSTSATSTTDAANTKVTLNNGDNKLSFGSGAINLNTLFNQAIQTGNFAVLKPLFANNVDFVIYKGGPGDFPTATTTTANADGAATLLAGRLQGVTNWSTTKFATQLTGIKSFVGREFPDYSTTNTLGAAGTSKGTYDQDWYSYVLVTPDASGKISKVMLASQFNSVN